MRKLLVLLLLVCPVLQSQQTLDNTAVIKLSKARLTDDLIITTINASPGNYDISTNGLIALKAAKVSDKVVAAIVLKASATGQTAAPAAGASSSGAAFGAAPSGPNGLPVGIDDVGVYYRDKSGAWVAMLPEIVNFESTGKLKKIASAGIVKGNLDGRVEGSRARVSASLPLDFAVYLPPAVEITEYVLFRLHPTNTGTRTFLSASGGLLHTQAGAQRDEIDFQPEKLAPRLYQITLPVVEGKGEYGLLAPGNTSTSNKETSAKIYTVSVVE